MFPDFIPLSFFIPKDQLERCQQLARKWIDERQRVGKPADKFTEVEIEKQLILTALAGRLTIERKYPDVSLSDDQNRVFYETVREACVDKLTKPDGDVAPHSEPDEAQRFINLFKEVFFEALEEELKERHEEKLEKS